MIESSHFTDEPIFDCQCHTELLRLTKEPDYRNIYVARWHCQPGKTSWLHRLRHIWKILREGDPYSDEIVLNYDDAQRMAEWLKYNAR